MPICEDCGRHEAEYQRVVEYLAEPAVIEVCEHCRHGYGEDGRVVIERRSEKNRTDPEPIDRID